MMTMCYMGNDDIIARVRHHYCAPTLAAPRHADINDDYERNDEVDDDIGHATTNDDRGHANGAPQRQVKESTVKFLKYHAGVVQLSLWLPSYMVMMLHRFSKFSLFNFFF
jgi:hypothetical protein